jgi:hypothetical protein
VICFFFPFSSVSTLGFELETLSANDKHAKPLDHAAAQPLINFCQAIMPTHFVSDSVISAKVEQDGGLRLSIQARFPTGKKN